METKMKMRLMLTVLEDIRADRRAKVDMTGWGRSTDEPGLPEPLGWLPNKRLDAEWENPSCRTVACFAGWAFIYPPIRRAMRTDGYFDPREVQEWLSYGTCLDGYDDIFVPLFSPNLSTGRTKAQTLKVIERNLRKLYKDMGYTDKLVSVPGPV